MCIEMGLGPPSAPPSGNMSTHACSRKAIYGGLPSHTARRLNVNTIIAERPATKSIH
jgi:hypothetical protein